MLSQYAALLGILCALEIYSARFLLSPLLIRSFLSRFLVMAFRLHGFKNNGLSLSLVFIAARISDSCSYQDQGDRRIGGLYGEPSGA